MNKKGGLKILNIITFILSSSVIAALFTAFINSRIKSKELYVQIKLEEQNKWIMNVDNSLKDCLYTISIYNLELMRYSQKEITRLDISQGLIESNKAINTFLFYVYQTEFSNLSIEEIENTTKNITSAMNKQLNASIEFLNSRIDEKKLHEIATDCEKEIGENNRKLSVKTGDLIRSEKILLTDSTKNNFMEFLKEIFKRTTNGQ